MTRAERQARIGVLTISDRASAGIYEDKSGPAIRQVLEEVLSVPWLPISRMIPDERSAIEQALVELADQEGCALIVTTGGTGPAVRDVTPEATAAVCQKLLPGFGELMRAISLIRVPTAILSRQTAGIRGGSLIGIGIFALLVDCLEHRHDFSGGEGGHTGTPLSRRDSIFAACS